MSGGSWDYFSFRLQEVADRLLREKSPIRMAFGSHLTKCADALYDIEWVDSGDKSPGDEIQKIKEVLEDTVAEKVAIETKEKLKELRDEIDKLIDKGLP